MVAEIPEFDETDFKTITASCNGGSMGSLDEKAGTQAINFLLAKIGIITGVEIPANQNVFTLLRTEILKNIVSTKKYSVLTLLELEQAFLMMANGDFGDIKDWGKSLNLKFFFDVVNSYCSYRGGLMTRFLDWQDLKTRKMEIKSAPEVKNNYELTERAYQQFLSGKYDLSTWYYKCYDDLVECGWIEKDRYKEFEKKAVSLLTKEMHTEIMFQEKKNKKINGSNYTSTDGLPISIGKYMQAINGLTTVKDEKIKIEILAKQISMATYFKFVAGNGIEHLFVPE